MIHVETFETRRVAVSGEIMDRIRYVQDFFPHAKLQPSSALIIAHGTLLLSEFYSAKENRKLFCSQRAGVEVPFSLTAIRRDMREKKIGYYELTEIPPDVMKALKQLRRKTRLKREEDVAILGIGFLHDVLHRFVAGDRLIIGPIEDSLREYIPEVVKGYRPVLMN